MSNFDQFKTILADNGYRVTTARERTFKLLLHAEPQTMQQIVQRADNNIDRVSVYRNIDLFEKIGIIRRVYFGWKYKIELSDAFLSHHHHLVCLECGQTIPIEDEEHMTQFIRRVSDENDFKPVRHSFDIEGYCKNCAENATTAA